MLVLGTSSLVLLIHLTCVLAGFVMTRRELRRVGPGH
jgi:hypothetical protein